MKRTYSVFIVFFLTHITIYCQVDTSIFTSLKNQQQVSISQLKNIMPSDSTHLSQALSENEIYIDSTIVLNDSVAYTIFSFSDTLAVCSYYYLLSFNFQLNVPISYAYLFSDCDFDFYNRVMQINSFEFLSKDTLLVSKELLEYYINGLNEEQDVETEDDNFTLISKTLILFYIKEKGVVYFEEKNLPE